jgi:hypothetical protein
MNNYSFCDLSGSVFYFVPNGRCVTLPIVASGGGSNVRFNNFTVISLSAFQNGNRKNLPMMARRKRNSQDFRNTLTFLAILATIRKRNESIGKYQHFMSSNETKNNNFTGPLQNKGRF